jgi:hypothetical protein
VQLLHLPQRFPEQSHVILIAQNGRSIRQHTGDEIIDIWQIQPPNFRAYRFLKVIHNRSRDITPRSRGILIIYNRSRDITPRSRGILAAPLLLP